MPTKTPHTPQNQTPSPTGRESEKWGLSQKMRPPIITPEITKLVEEMRELAITALPDIERIQKELEQKEQNKQNEYIEINWIKLETENLKKPQNPEIQINQAKASETIPQAWEEDWNWYYNFPWAQAEAKFLWKTIPTKEQWEQICKPFWQEWERLSKELNLPMNGYRNFSDGSLNDQSSVAYYWSSSPNTTGAYNLYFPTTAVFPAVNSNRAYGFSVRCVKN